MDAESTRMMKNCKSYNFQWDTIHFKIFIKDDLIFETIVDLVTKSFFQCVKFSREKVSLFALFKMT